MANAVVQACPHWVVVGVKMVWLHALHIVGGVHKAVWWVCGDGDCALKVAHKEAKGAPLARVAPGFESYPHHLEVNFYILDKVKGLVWHV